MKSKKIFELIAIISSIGMIVWIITSFFGGMYIYFLTYGIIIIPIIILYNVSFVDTFICVIKRGVRANRMKVSLHANVIILIIAMVLFQSDLFKSKRVLTATLKVEPFFYTLILRQNGICESEAFSMMGYKEYYRGKYKFNGDTIVLLKKPANLKFAPDTMLLDRASQVIYYDRDQEGKLIKALDWPNHFEIR